VAWLVSRWASLWLVACWSLLEGVHWLLASIRMSLFWGMLVLIAGCLVPVEALN
jgi:hypothetical protein